MQGIMADPESRGTFYLIAKRACEIADSLIEALNKESNE